MFARVVTGNTENRAWYSSPQFSWHLTRTQKGYLYSQLFFTMFFECSAFVDDYGSLVLIDENVEMIDLLMDRFEI
jgi:hypothetical protein